MNREKLHQILELARWAPSGDNTQPWRFEIVDDNSVRVHGFDTRDHILYDFNGHPSHIAHGALLETIRIAASGSGLDTSWTVQSQSDERHPVYEVKFTDMPTITRDPLFECIETRTVQRRPMRTSPLSELQRKALTDAGGSDFHVQLLDSAIDRMRVAHLLWKSAKIRLVCPEAYPVHKEIIEWRSRFSKDRIPDQAIGVDPATARLMEWVMTSWERVDFFNRYLLGTVAPRVQLDLLPGFFCASHLLVRPVRQPAHMTDWVCLGMAVQRIWLTATRHGLHFQPQMTPVIFRWYAQARRRFSSVEHLFGDSLALSSRFEKISGSTSDDHFGFFARVGTCRSPNSRSIRLDLPDLMK
jgi:hypothetical protein